MKPLDLEHPDLPTSTVDAHDVALDALRRPATDEGVIELEPVAADLKRRGDFRQVGATRPSTLPWSPEARARGRARDLALDAQLDVFRDNLRAIRAAHEVLNRVATARVADAAETAVLSIRGRGETARLAITNRIQLDMTREFLTQLEYLDGLRGRINPDVLDALKERALAEFTTRLNRAARTEPEGRHGSSGGRP